MSLKVSFNDFTRDPVELHQDELSVVDEVIRSGWWVLGKHVSAFESSWATACEVAGTVGVSNGLDALEIGLELSELGLVMR